MLEFKMEIDASEIKRKLGKIDGDKAVKAVIDYNAAYAEGWMKSNAPWTDRTGAARSGLMAIPYNNELLLAYSVWYGIWLEIANNGRYQILIPAMRVVGEKIIRDLEKIIYKI